MTATQVESKVESGVLVAGQTPGVVIPGYLECLNSMVTGKWQALDSRPKQGLAGTYFNQNANMAFISALLLTLALDQVFAAFNGELIPFNRGKNSFFDDGTLNDFSLFWYICAVCCFMFSTLSCVFNILAGGMVRDDEGTFVLLKGLGKWAHFSYNSFQIGIVSYAVPIWLGMVVSPIHQNSLYYLLIAGSFFSAIFALGFIPKVIRSVYVVQKEIAENPPTHLSIAQIDAKFEEFLKTYGEEALTLDKFTASLAPTTALGYNGGVTHITQLRCERVFNERCKKLAFGEGK
jgi:hypothetical protein